MQMNLDHLTGTSTMVGVADYFDKVAAGDKLVWAKAVAPQGRQVCLDIMGPNKQRYKVPEIKAGDPICLSKFAPLSILREASDLIQGATSTPPILKLMLTSEVNEYFARKSKVLKVDPRDLRAQAEEDARRAASKRQLSDSEVDHGQAIQSGFVSIQDNINPHIEYLCAQVHVMLDADKRMPVSAFMGELLAIEDSLSMDDLEYIKALGFYPTAKNWAEKKQNELGQQLGIIPQSDELSE